MFSAPWCLVSLMNRAFFVHGKTCTYIWKINVLLNDLHLTEWKFSMTESFWRPLVVDYWNLHVCGLSLPDSNVKTRNHYSLSFLLAISNHINCNANENDLVCLAGWYAGGATQHSYRRVRCEGTFCRNALKSNRCLMTSRPTHFIVSCTD